MFINDFNIINNGSSRCANIHAFVPELDSKLLYVGTHTRMYFIHICVHLLKQSHQREKEIFYLNKRSDSLGLVDRFTDNEVIINTL